MTILELAGVLFCENEQTWTKWIIACSEENTYLVPKEARGGFKATAAKKVTTLLSFYSHSFLLLSILKPLSCFPWEAMLETISAHFGHCEPKTF